MRDFRLVELDESMRDEFLAYVEESLRADGGIVPWVLRMDGDDFAGHVRYLKAQSLGKDIKDGWVASTTYFLVDSSGRILGVSNLRHALTPHLLHEGGHIGYSVRPSERRKGYGTAMCARVLEKARELGLERALITCDDDNIASARVIEKNGGVLENIVTPANRNKPKRRYWVDLGGR